MSRIIMSLDLDLNSIISDITVFFLARHKTRIRCYNRFPGQITLHDDVNFPYHAKKMNFYGTR